MSASPWCRTVSVLRRGAIARCAKSAAAKKDSRCTTVPTPIYSRSPWGISNWCARPATGSCMQSRMPHTWVLVARASRSDACSWPASLRVSCWCAARRAGTGPGRRRQPRRDRERDAGGGLYTRLSCVWGQGGRRVGMVLD
jgi:hypothetical protein